MDGKSGRVCNSCSGQASTSAVRLNAIQLLGMRAEKKLLGDLSGSKGVVDAVLTDDTKELLDAFSSYIQHVSKDQEVATAIRKDLVKIVVKVGVLARHGQLSKDELGHIQTLRKALRKAFNAIITFEETPFTYDHEILRECFAQSEALLLQVIEGKLTERSRQRVNDVFGWLKEPENLAPLFNDKACAPHLRRISAALKVTLDGNF